MSRRLLDYDPLTGISTWHDYDHATRETIIETSQDCEPILNRTRALANEPDYWRKGVKGSFAHAACIPIVFQHKWLTEHGLNVFESNADPDVWKRVQRLLNGEYRYLKTTDKKI